MAVSFVARKCACGGKLEFDSAKKIWICKYCGTVVEREATFDKVQVDGIEGISDVVRQTIRDVADGRMESAARNLEDCERKNHKHVGTLIANISYNLAMTSCAGSQEEARGYIDKVKMYAGRLQAEFPDIAEDEINMYEAFGDNVANVYANLLVVFDTLNDSGRIEYISSRLHPSEIFSVPANKSLLKISLKRGNYDVAEAVVRNTNHNDKTYSLQEILLHYPDNDTKRELIGLLFDGETAEALTKAFFEQYFADSTDSVGLKTYLIQKLVLTSLHCNMEAVVKAVHGQMDGYDSAKGVFSALYGTKVSDQETEALLEFCLMENQSYEILRAFFDALSEKNIFVQLGSGVVISFMESTQYGVGEKRDVIARMFQFEIDARAKDAIYNYYLNSNTDPVQDRLQILEVLLTEGCPVSYNTVRNYVVDTTVDGEDKLTVLQRILATGVNKTYMGELLSEYLLSSRDQGEVKDRISGYLVEEGFKVEANVFTQYIISSNDSAEQKADKAKRLVQNGTQIRMDCLDQYLLSIDAPMDLPEALFQVLTSNTFAVGAGAYARFLLYCRDIDKVRHSARLAGNLNGSLNGAQVTVSHGGDNISCNILQAYVLNSTDHYDVAKAVVSGLLAEKLKLNTEITVNGTPAKFKKYVGEKKAGLSPLTLQLCEENKMFSLF